MDGKDMPLNLNFKNVDIMISNKRDFKANTNNGAKNNDFKMIEDSMHRITEKFLNYMHVLANLDKIKIRAKIQRNTMRN